jgi:ubiquinol-cytochrome c reductase cytochrome c1 subunit
MGTAMILRATLLALACVVSLGVADRARAAEGGAHPIEMEWHFNGLFGQFDRAAAQRGLQVYREVCSACHALEFVAFRNLAELGFTEEEVRAVATQYTVTDGPNDAGEMFERPAIPSDYFPAPFANEQAARAANNGAYPPNLSLITKARANGPDYVYSLLVGYEEPPADAEAPEGMHFNTYFPSQWIAMAQPLYDDGVTYTDGTAATIDQMAYDTVNFLHWAAEPKLEVRKSTGLKVMLFLIALTALFYATKRKIWADVAH